MLNHVLLSHSGSNMSELDTRVLTWIKEQRERGACIDGRTIQQKALELGQQLGLVDFRASNGWLANFLERSRLSLRYS